MARAAGWRGVAAITACSVGTGIIAVALAHNGVGPTIMATAFGLLAAAAALTLDEPANAVVDVTPTGIARQSAARACALSLPLAGGLVLVLAVSARHSGLPAIAMIVALLGNVMFGFALACTARRRTGEPGAWAAPAVVLFLVAVPQLGQLGLRINTFPSPPPQPSGLSSDAWWIVISAVGVMAMTATSWHRAMARRLQQR